MKSATRELATLRKCATLDRELLAALSGIPEVAASGFAVRKGLAGTGVTILKGDNYFGSWRVASGDLVWVNAKRWEPNHTVDSVDEAVRHTMLLILRSLETTSPNSVPQSAPNAVGSRRRSKA
jgi:hypothetical protein